mmetsp:Transcript_74363/g.240396  ORF Transcript_74363/g.240396 Transcript_74363/m.240396 type:complete len:120 (+) Transcript_74363:951-1310(+)
MLWHRYFELWGPVAQNCSQLLAAAASSAFAPERGDRSRSGGAAELPVLVRPGVGSAVLFYNHLPRGGPTPPQQPGRRGRPRGAAAGYPPGELDPCALHMGCRVASGRKVVLAHWLHVEP